jgi:hypothetical protein
MLEFTGELVSRLERETVHDPHTRTIREYSLYRTDEGQYLLFLESRREVRSKGRYLKFESPDDVYQYVKRLEDDEEAARSVIDVEASREK